MSLIGLAFVCVFYAVMGWLWVCKFGVVTTDRGSDGLCCVNLQVVATRVVTSYAPTIALAIRKFGIDMGLRHGDQASFGRIWGLT